MLFSQTQAISIVYVPHYAQRKELKEYFEIDGQVKAAAIKTDLDTCKAIADALDAIKAPKNHPAVLQLALDVTDMTESPDKCLSLVVNAYEAFAKRMQTQAGIFAVFAQETQPQESLRRVRRAAENVSWADVPCGRRPGRTLLSS